MVCYPVCSWKVAANTYEELIAVNNTTDTWSISILHSICYNILARLYDYVIVTSNKSFLLIHVTKLFLWGHHNVICGDG